MPLPQQSYAEKTLVILAREKLERPIELVKLLDLGLKSKPDDTALVSLERKWSWRELDQASTRLGRQYLKLGLVPGDRVASLMPNRGAIIVHYLACLKAGLTASPLNYRYQASRTQSGMTCSPRANRSLSFLWAASVMAPKMGRLNSSRSS